MWGMDEREFLNGDPQAIKYQNPNNTNLGWACWILERWVGSQFFRERDWNDMRYGEDSAGTGALVDYLGPYRTRGQYILWYPLISNDYEPLELSSQLLDLITERVKLGQELSAQEAYAMREVQRRRKMAANAAVTEYQLEEQREYFRQNKERLNNLATTEYGGLDTARAVGTHMRKVAASEMTNIATVLPSVKDLLCPHSSNKSATCSTQTP